MKPNRSNLLPPLLYRSLGATLFIAPLLHAAPSTWTGATDGTWSTAGNWAGTVIPDNAAATFNNNVNTTITTPATLNNVSLAFTDSAATGAFVIGSLAGGVPGTSATTITGFSGFSITVGTAGSSLITKTQTVNANVTLGTRSSNANVSFTDHSSAVAQSLILNGNVAINNSGLGVWSVQFRGNGDKVSNGIISDAGTSGTVVSIGGGGTNTGKTTLNGINTYAGGTTMGGGDAGLVLGNKSALGTGKLTLNPSGGASRISAVSTLTGANAVANSIDYTTAGGTMRFTGSNSFEFSGATNLNTTAGAATRTFQVDVGITTTLSGILSETGSTGISKTGDGALALSNANSFTGTVAVSGGTLLLNAQSGSSTGTSAFIGVNSGGTLGGNGRTSALISINAGAGLRIGGSTGESTGVLTSTSSSVSALVLNANSSTFIDINSPTRGAGYDAFETFGRVNYGGDIDTDFGSLAAIGHSVYNLFEFASIGASDFNSFDITGAYTASLSLSGTGGTGIWTGMSGPDTTFSFEQSTGDLTVTVIPEPGATMLLGGLGGLALLRRRRNG